MSNKQTEALKLALEALEVATTPLAKDRQEVLRAQAAVREALDEQPAQQQEPFGYFRYDLRLDAWVQNREGRPGTPFYTSPPAQRKPLTDEQITEHFKENVDTGSLLSFADGVRFAEAAHGITGKTK